MARLDRSVRFLALVAILAGCGGKGSSSGPLVLATVAGVTAGQAHPALAGYAEVVVADAAGTAFISTATVRVNGVVLPYVAASGAYEGRPDVQPGAPVTISVTGAGKDVSVMVQQASSYATITAPAGGASWSGLSPNTLAWSAAVPTPGLGYFVSITDLDGNFVWPPWEPLQLPASATSLEIPAGSLSEGERIAVVGGATLHPFPGAAPGSGVLLLGLDGLPLHVTTGALVASAPGAAQLLATAGRLVWTDASDAPVKSAPATGGPSTAVVERHGAPEGALQVGAHLYWISGPHLLRSGLDGLGTTVLAERPDPGSYSRMGHLAVDADAAYWVNPVPGSTCLPSFDCPQALVRVPLSGGPAVTLATTEYQVVGIAADDTRLYWIQRGAGVAGAPSGVLAVAKVGGDVTVLVDGVYPMCGVAVDAGRVVFCSADYNGGYRILSVPVAGGAVTDIYQNSEEFGWYYASQIVAAGGAAYWIDPRAVRTAPVAGGAVSTLASGIARGSGLAVGLGQVAWAEADPSGNSRIRAASTSGGEATTLAENLSSPEGLRIDEATAVVTWVEGGYDGETNARDRIARVPLSGGVVTTVLRSLASTRPRIASDGTSVFLAEGCEVLRAPLSGGAPESVVVVSSRPYGCGVMAVATDGTHLVSLVVDGTLVRTPLAGGATEVLFAPGDGIWHSGSFEVVVSAGVVTWVTPHPVNPVTHVLRRTPVTGGGVVAEVLIPPVSALVADAEAAYYADTYGQIFRVAPAGGEPTRLAEGLSQGEKVSLAIDGASLYWADGSHVGQVDIGSLEARYRVALQGEYAVDAPSLVAVDADRFYWTQPLSGVLKRSDGK